MNSKVINIILILVIFNTNIFSQDIVNIKVGGLVTSVHNNNLSYRPGYNIGFGVRVGSPGFFMSPGLYYQKFTISEYNKKEYLNNNPSYSLIKINTNAGFENTIVSWLMYRIYTGVNLNYVFKIDNNAQNINFNNIYEGFVGYNFGIGITISFVILDLKWEKSFTEFYRDFNKTRLNFSTISLGVVF